MSTQSKRDSGISFAESSSIVERKARERLKQLLLPNFTADWQGNDHMVLQEVPRERKFLWWTWSGLGKDRVGRLGFHPEKKISTPDGVSRRWCLFVYGRKNVEMFKGIAERLSEEFHVHIHVRLESEEPESFN